MTVSVFSFSVFFCFFNIVVKLRKRFVLFAFSLKVAQDLGALFGTTLNTRNYTRPHNHDHEQNHDHDHNHDHGHDHNYDHGHENIRVNTSEAPKVIPISKGQKENVTKINTSKGKDIEVKKKSTDWSQYFGIDRRKKKTTFLARPGTQDQDDEWMLQRYYEVYFFFFSLKSLTHSPITITKFFDKTTFLLFTP